MRWIWLKWTAVVGAPLLVTWYFCRPVLVLHYSPQAHEPVAYILTENDHVTRRQLSPGEAERFYTPMFVPQDAWIEVSLPLASRDGVTIKPPFSRVDLYIDQFAKIERTDVKYGFFDRFQSSVPQGVNESSWQTRGQRPPGRAATVVATHRDIFCINIQYPRPVGRSTPVIGTARGISRSSMSSSVVIRLRLVRLQ